MTEKASQPFEVFSTPKDFLAAPQNFFPAGRFFERYAEAARAVTQAQITYGQALMRANAAFLGACFEPRAAAEKAKHEDERPSVAARHAEFAEP